MVFSKKEFFVVKFTVDNSVAVVSANWMIGVAKCKYPKENVANKLCLKKASPEQSWPVYNVHILKGFGKH